MLLQDLLQVLAVDVGIPGVLRIDHDHGSFSTTIETTGGVDAHPATPRQTQLLGATLEEIAHRRGPALVAALAAVLALVGAEEDMVTVVRHLK